MRVEDFIFFLFFFSPSAAPKGLTFNTHAYPLAIFARCASPDSFDSRGP
jgi:hypothetical protein